jgi:uncharacterized protein YuzE
MASLKEVEMRISTDRRADAAYIHVQDVPSARTEELHDGLIVDLAADGTIVGVEILGVSHGWDPASLEQFGLTERDFAAMRALTMPSRVAISGGHSDAPLVSSKAQPVLAGASLA